MSVKCFKRLLENVKGMNKKLSEESKQMKNKGSY